MCNSKESEDKPISIEKEDGRRQILALSKEFPLSKITKYNLLILFKGNSWQGKIFQIVDDALIDIVYIYYQFITYYYIMSFGVSVCLSQRQI